MNQHSTLLLLVIVFLAAHRRSLFILISFATFVLSLIPICLAMRARQARMSLITMQYAVHRSHNNTLTLEEHVSS